MSVSEIARSEALEATGDLLAELAGAIPDRFLPAIHSALQVVWIEGQIAGSLSAIEKLNEALGG